jgi:hypothetical protein
VIISASLALFLVLAPLSRRLRRHSQALATGNVEFASGVQEIVRMAE